MKVRKIIVCFAAIAAAAFIRLDAKTCTWVGGSGSWNTSANWQGNEVPANGDVVVIENDTASAVIVNDIEGLTLSQLFVTGSAAATLSGNGVTLTDANAFSNGVASTDMSMPMTLTATSPMLKTYDAMVFRGNITAASATKLTFYYTRAAGYHVQVRGEVNAPNANISIEPNGDVNRLYRTFTFYGKVVAAALFKGYSSNSIRDNIYLGSSENSIPDITAPYANIHCDAANVMTNAILRFGYCEGGSRAYYRLWYYSQKIDRFDGSASTRDNATVWGGEGSYKPVITMEATGDSYCPATFVYNISLVWAPKGNYTLTFGKNRANSNTGTISVNGGKAILAGSASFKNVTALTVAAGAEFQMNSTADSAFQSVSTLTVGSGGKFTIDADASLPFTDGTLNIVAAADSEITIPPGMTVSCASALVDGDYLGGPATTYTGWDNANPGSATRLRCLRGEGHLYVPAHGRTCRWLGGSGSWSDITKWKNSGVPAAGDQVVISNDAASATIVNDISGLSLASIAVIGSAAATLSGSSVTLTEAEAFSNGVAGTVCNMPIAFASSAPYVRTIGNITVGGDLTGTTPTTFNVVLSSSTATTPTITFNGAVNMPNANIRLYRPNQNWNAHNIYFNGVVTAAALMEGMSADAMLRYVRLANSGNSIGTVKAAYPQIICSADNVMRGAALQFGYCEAQSGKFDFGATSQTIDRFDGTIGGQGQGYVSGSGTLTMEATGNCPCPATFQNAVSLVWAPKGNYALTFTNTAISDQPTTGTLSFNGGTATLDGARRFANALAVSVGAGATFICSSTSVGAFASATSLTVGSGGKFTITSGAENPFTDDLMDIVAATNAEITIPSGMTFRCKSFKLGDGYVTGEGAYYTGTDNPNPGTARTIACLRGAGMVYVPYRAPEATASTWTGGGGANESAHLAANWGGTLPDLTEGSLTATFASGGTRADLSGGEKFTGFLFSGVESFEVASSGATPASLYTGGVTCSSAGSFAISSPLSLAAVQTWTVGTGASLDVSGALSSPSDYTLNVVGDGTLTLRGGNSAFSGAMVFDGCTTHASGSEPFGSSSATFTTSGATGGANVYFDGVTVSAPVVCNETHGNRYGSFNFAANVTNVFNGSFTFTGLARPSIRGTTIFAGGLNHTSGSRLIPAYGYAGTFIVTNIPAKITVGLQCDAACTWKFYAASNDFGTVGAQLSAGSSMFCGVDWALDNAAMPLIFCYGAFLDMNGHDQRIGSLRFANTANTSGSIHSSTGPATLYFTQSSVATNNVTRIYGEVSLVKAGASEFAVNRAVEATGALDVAEGSFAFTSSGSWANATNVTVRGAGSLSLASSAAFNRKVHVEIADSGKVVIADGVAQRVGMLCINGVRMPGGTWGSSESAADNKDDVHFAGKGVLSVASGSILIVW
ncbi:MAG: hypothetical protein IJG84_07260 [Kiritimatiellae bacterium]|nr:hypothetical protein [Kiritimatiellia bacterium]